MSRLTRNRACSWTCLTASERLVAAGTAEDRLVIVWSAASGQVVAALPGHTSPLTSLHFSLVSITGCRPPPLLNPMEGRARIFKRLWSPGINSKV